ncbi:putative 3-oxoacyl-[acyl-carrier-protein] synthase [Burkholderia cenocepacia]|uniref:Putative 3-oxoacyl-[acyl-carrier-protein] synthase n=1 Tax=Burkholderia cenocepacia TaxID=95486 RepID=A0A6J5JNI9_9BURK|nr:MULTISPECIES: 3-oxoacyl-ACP synthase [Burkholderia cepacia complex]RQT22604.1 3-oxoacyl-ACP synthase [Burkholderia cepacia]CAB3972735.1 putative 3-oxoacyl-[acyl-carrier-protein] synthase [Burkholderia cenocepacia]
MVDTTIGIPCVAYHLPEHVDSVRHWARRTGQPAAVVAKLEQAGVRNFHVARGQSAFSLAIQAVDSLLRNAPIARESIDCLVYTHTLQGSIAPPPASLPRQLCEHFGLIDVQSFSFAQQHCASSLGALRIIRAMFIARPALHRVLLVGADVMPMETERTMGASALLSDGAFAALVERHARTNRLVALATHASGRGWRGMLGQTEARFLAQYQLVARKLITQVTQDAHVALTELYRILPPHLNQPAWRRLVQSMGLPPERLFAHNFSRIAHVTVCDPFINLADCGPLAPGAPLLLYAQGVGGFSATALLIH